jgi:hypothetical protein
MPDELVTVSAAKVLKQICDSLDKAQQELDSSLSQIESWLQLKNAGPDSSEVTLQQFVTKRESELLRLRGHVQSALGAVHMLAVMPSHSTDSREPQDDGVDPKPSQGNTSVVVTGVSATTIHRMSEVEESLKLTPQQTLERCVATQHYVDSKLRERWQFFVKRGRERRAVSFPGQMTV